VSDRSWGQALEAMRANPSAPGKALDLGVQRALVLAHPRDWEGVLGTLPPATEPDEPTADPLNHAPPELLAITAALFSKIEAAGGAGARTAPLAQGNLRPLAGVATRSSPISASREIASSSSSSRGAGPSSVSPVGRTPSLPSDTSPTSRSISRRWKPPRASPRSPASSPPPQSLCCQPSPASSFPGRPAPRPHAPAGAPRASADLIELMDLEGPRNHLCIREQQ